MTDFDRELSELRNDWVEPAPGAKRRVSARLALSVGALGVGSATATVARQSLAWVKTAKIVATVVLGSAVGVGAISVVSPSATEPVVHRRPVTVPSATHQIVPEAPRAPEPPPTVIPVPPPRVFMPAAPSAASDRAASLAEQQALLDEARASFAQGDYTRTASALASHAELFPASMLREEREALLIKTLAASKRTSEARARAEHFRTQYPQSLLLPSIEHSLITNP